MEKSKLKNQKYDISEYEYSSLDSVSSDLVANKSAKLFKFREIYKDQTPEVAEAEAQTLRVERRHAKEKSFKISPVVMEHRGLLTQEEQEWEKSVKDEVDRRVKNLTQDAINKGFEQGVKQGREEVYHQTKAMAEEKIAILMEMIKEVLATQEQILTVQKKQVYDVIRNLTKWVILRELSQDGKYIERLLEKLIAEIQTKANLLIQINPNKLSDMPEILENIKQKLGEMPNVRVEANYEIVDAGMILESKNGIINGTMEEQFRSLDALFATVGIND